jgi:hypothetical protein
MNNIIFIVETKVDSQFLSLPLDRNAFVNVIRAKERTISFAEYHPIVPQCKLLKGLIKSTQN